jgi:hypothetical protein
MTEIMQSATGSRTLRVVASSRPALGHTFCRSQSGLRSLRNLEGDLARSRRQRAHRDGAVFGSTEGVMRKLADKLQL